MKKRIILIFSLLTSVLVLPRAGGQLQLELSGDYNSEVSWLLDPRLELSGFYDLYLPINRSLSLQGYLGGELGYQHPSRQWLYSYTAELAFSGLTDSFRFMPMLHLDGEQAYSAAFTAPDFQAYSFTTLLSYFPGQQEISLTPGLSWTNGSLFLEGELNFAAQLGQNTTMSFFITGAGTVFLFTDAQWFLTSGLSRSLYFDNFSEIEATFDYTYADSDFTLPLGSTAELIEVMDYQAVGLKVSASTYIGDLLVSLDLPADIRWKKHGALQAALLLAEKEWSFGLEPLVRVDYIWRENFTWQFSAELKKVFSNSSAEAVFSFILVAGGRFIF